MKQLLKQFDSETVGYACEVCKKETPIEQVVSFHVLIAVSGIPLQGPVHCDDTQHFACGLEHAAVLARKCIDEHLIPAHESLRNGGTS